MDFLRYLDVLIGYALAMIVLSTMIATAAGAWLAAIGSRARHLENGLGAMLATISGMGLTEGQALATDILRDPTVKPFGKLELFVRRWNIPWLPAILRWIRSCAAETVTREELALMILRQASEGCEAAIRALGVPLTAEEAASLQKARAALAAAGTGSDEKSRAERDKLKEVIRSLPVVMAAQEMLANVEQQMLKIEVEEPSLPAQAWRTKALQKASARLAARLFPQFDNVMDRVEDNARYSGKVMAAAFSAAFLYWYPVDSMAMLTRLSADQAALRIVVDAATDVNAAVAGTAVADAEKKLLQMGLFGDFDSGKRVFDPGVNLGGVFATWMMVSLGAPFWLHVLDQLLGLRSLMSQKASEQRAWREQDQRSQPAGAAPAAASAAAAAAGSGQ